MTKTKSTRRALLSSALALLLCVSMLVGSTFAWFTDSVTSGSNIIKSGNLDVEMHYMDGKYAPTATAAEWQDAEGASIFNYELWEPGYTEVRHIKISNEGSLALKSPSRAMGTSTWISSAPTCTFTALEASSMPANTAQRSAPPTLPLTSR